MPPRADNLRESTHRVVRLVALGHLADAAAARDRLSDPTDAEALHDFRVALRRLRSWERAFRPYMRDDLSRKLRRRLRKLASDTGASRDLEVHLAWLAEQRETLRRRERPGVNWLLATLERQKAEADAVLERDVEARFARLHAKLERGLVSYREKLRVRDGGGAAPPAPFAGALAPRVREAAGVLRTNLERVRSASDARDGHEARIAAKRARYLLEPVSRLVPGAAEVVERLKSLQDLLGDLHDAQVFGAEIEALAAEVGARTAARAVAPVDATTPAPSTANDTVTTDGDESRTARAASTAAPSEASAASGGSDVGVAGAASAASERRDAAVLASDPRPPLRAAPNPLPGLAALAERLRERTTTAFGRFAGEWLGDGSADFFREIEAVATRIADAVTAGLEIERKYLLRFLPDDARDGQRMDIEQGYVPGEQLHERVRRVTVRRGSGRKDIAFYRTVKVGEGVARTEIEEETTAEIFDALWPLTRGRRLRKRRYAVEIDGRTWEVDVFRNRKLVLAEIELESEDERVVIPEWLAAAVEREVTTEAAYQNINLAR